MVVGCGLEGAFRGKNQGELDNGNHQGRKAQVGLPEDLRAEKQKASDGVLGQERSGAGLDNS